MVCQICKKNTLSELSVRCPACGTNISALRQLEDIQEKYIDNAKQRTYLEGSIITQQKAAEMEVSKWKRTSIRVFSLILLLPLICKCCGIPKADESMAKRAIAQRDSIFQYSHVLEKQIVDLQRDTSALVATKVKSIKYTLIQGESLSELGLKFFNNRKAGYRIAKDNQLNATEYTKLPVGKTLIINFR
jgi:hypothetical protein